MTRVLESLRRDHLNMAQLLDALERQLAVFDRGETPDYDIIRGVVDYCLTYPDLHHHPKEDLVYERLLAAEPAAARAAGDLAAEHRQLAETTRRFAAALRSVLLDLEVPRDAFDAAARAFLDRYRQHMEKEERDFMPAAERVLGDADWAAIDARLAHRDDPLFGPEVEQRFAKLRTDILHWSEE